MPQQKEGIPTAEEFYNLNPETIQDIAIGRSMHTKRVMIEFAKLHVTEALKAASDNAVLISTKTAKDSIINAYPLTNIK
jgi:hypothetical protein